MCGQRVECGDDVAQIVFARHHLELGPRLLVAAEIERQTDAAERRHLTRPRHIPLLAAAPAVHEEHTGKPRASCHERAGDLLTVYVDGDDLIVGRHAVPPARSE